MNCRFLNKITKGDCKQFLPELAAGSIDLFLSDIPYGINLDAWDVLHKNTNSALLGKSPAQSGKSAFRRRGKPINGWAKSDRNAGKEYQDWLRERTDILYPKMKPGAFLFVFSSRRGLNRVINAFENSGFLLKDILSWKKKRAHHRAQRLSNVLEKRGLHDQARKWEGWRLGNLAPVWEPIAWFMKPYKIGGTITDNVLEYGLGAVNMQAAKNKKIPTSNLLDFSFPEEQRFHEAQKPADLMAYLIELSVRENAVVLDPFIGSGTTALAAYKLNRNFIGFEINDKYADIAEQRLRKLKAKT